jgi:signal transduction histidine kinase
MSLWPRGLRKPRIRTVLLAGSLLILLAPLGGVWLLRLYESALIRQTETELISQAAVIAAIYRVAWAGPEARPTPGPEGQWTPRPAALDLARDPVLPPAPSAEFGAAAEPRALAAAATLSAVLVEAQRVTLAAMRVLDRQGVVVAASGEGLGFSLAAMPEVAEALAGRPASTLRARSVTSDQRRGAASISRSAAFRVFVAQPISERGEVIGAVLLSRTPPSIEQTLHHKRREIGLLVAALLLAAGGLALFTATTVSRPIQAVTAQARAVAAGAPPPARLRGSAVREADELSTAIHAMAATLAQRADYIGAFATEVSHEFKTPLAALRGALELLRDHEATMTPQERDRFLAQAQEDVARLDRLTRRLLDLARAEAPGPRVPATCDLASTVQAAAQPSQESGMAVAVSLPTLQVALPTEALRDVIANLLENVRQHAGPGVRCTIAFEGESGGFARVLLADDGRGISEGNAGRIFDRFFTTAREAGGTGLGLPLVRGSLEAAGGRIELARARPGAAFRLSLPRPA